jgi:UDP-N-acetylglucosamine 4-epimerase
LDYRDFRAGDVRHSFASISKAQALLGYAPTAKIDAGITAVMPYYFIENK